MLMNEVFSHFHLQLVTLYTSSDLWLNFLCLQFADFSRCRTTRAQQRRKSHLADFPQEVQAVLDSALVGVLLCHLQD